YGLDAELIDVEQECAVPAQELVKRFLTFVRPSLEEYGDWEEVSSIVLETIQKGNSATQQREVYKRRGSLEDVVDFIVAQTTKV
ncbi:MAG: carboxylate-amine ligase, partial [Mastigocladus sp. ERB_26_1]